MLEAEFIEILGLFEFLHDVNTLFLNVKEHNLNTEREQEWDCECKWTHLSGGHFGKYVSKALQHFRSSYPVILL